MLKQKKIELMKNPLPILFQSNIFSSQDNLNSLQNKQDKSIYITKKQKEFIIENNKSFYIEYKKLYKKNLENKKKLNEFINEKKRNNEIIINLEQKIEKSNNLNNNEINNINNNINENIIKYTPYIKRKRIRRKKKEIITKFSCNFPNCNKSYPTKCSLNMHIKLKHQQKNSDNLNNENIK